MIRVPWSDGPDKETDALVDDHKNFVTLGLLRVDIRSYGSSRWSRVKEYLFSSHGILTFLFLKILQFP